MIKKKETVKEFTTRIDGMINKYRERRAENRWGTVNKILSHYLEKSGGKCKGCGKPIVYGMYCDICTGLS